MLKRYFVQLEVEGIGPQIVVWRGKAKSLNDAYQKALMKTQLDLWIQAIGVTVKEEMN